MKTLLTLTLALMATTASAQEIKREATKAIVNMVVAERFCLLEAPKPIVVFYGEMAMEETGLNGEDLSRAAYEAADAMGKAYSEGGFLPIFCNNMRNVYQRMQ